MLVDPLTVYNIGKTTQNTALFTHKNGLVRLNPTQNIYIHCNRSRCRFWFHKTDRNSFLKNGVALFCAYAKDSCSVNVLPFNVYIFSSSISFSERRSLLRRLDKMLRDANNYTKKIEVIIIEKKSENFNVLLHMFILKCKQDM